MKCINDIVMFLGGKDNSLLELLKEKITTAADRLEFEKAARYRDELRAIKHVLNKQSLIQSSSKRRNIIAIEPIGRFCYKIFLFKGNRLIDMEPFSTEGICKISAVGYFHDIVINNFKNKNLKSLEMNEPLSQQDIDEAQIIYSYLKSKKNNIMSFWIPASWLADNNPKLIAGLDKIVGMLF